MQLLISTCFMEQAGHGSPCTSCCCSISSWRMADWCVCFATFLFSNSVPLCSTMEWYVPIASNTSCPPGQERNVTTCVREYKRDTGSHVTFGNLVADGDD